MSLFIEQTHLLATSGESSSVSLMIRHLLHLQHCTHTLLGPCGAAGLSTHVPAAMHDYDYETIR